MGYFGFDQLNIQYLEPPDDQHDDRCEALRWYWCASCERPFMESDMRPVNMCDCLQAFNKRYDECVCQWLGER